MFIDVFLKHRLEIFGCFGMIKIPWILFIYLSILSLHLFDIVSCSMAQGSIFIEKFDIITTYLY